MKKSDLKLRLKPIIKECINEILFEQGLLSNVISEVMRGLQPIQQRAPHRNNNIKKESELQKMQLQEERHATLKAQKRKLLDAAGFQTNIFEGVEPLSKGGIPDNEESPGSQHSALSGVDPNDAGVDIAGIMAVGGRAWKKML